MKKIVRNRERFECSCFSTEHHFIFSWWEDDDIDYPFELDLEVYLSTGPWYYRLWAGIKYICGHTSEYGHWDNTLLDADAVIRLHELTTLWIHENERRENLTALL